MEIQAAEERQIALAEAKAARARAGRAATRAEKDARLRERVLTVHRRGLKASEIAIWRWYRAGRFPEPHFLGERRAWFLEEIEASEAQRRAEQVERRRGARNLFRGRDREGDVTPSCDPAPGRAA